MSQKFIDNITLWALFVIALGDAVFFFIQLKNQRQACKQEHFQQAIKQEIQKLHNELKLLTTEVPESNRV